jgi:hypothetical protein
MVALWIVAALLAPPFWEVRPPSAWTVEEIRQLLSDSPWAQAAKAPREEQGILVYLATARPVREAEERRLGGGLRPGAESSAGEYRKFLRENAGKVIVLAVQLPLAAILQRAPDIPRMEQESVLKIGRRKYHMTGHFPPAPGDPYLRLVFPREVRPDDKTLNFELCLPGLPAPYRWAQFRLSQMKYRGEAEY